MKKSDIKRSKILEFLTKNPGSSSTQIAEFLGVHVVTAHTYLKELVDSGTVTKEGNTRSTRYYFREKIGFPFDKNRVEKKVMSRIEGLEILHEKNLEKLLERYILVQNPDGTFESGFQGIFRILTKERQAQSPTEQEYVDGVCDFFTSLDDAESRRRENGFFDGTQSLREIMRKYSTKTGIDTLIFCEMLHLGSRWRLRTGTELRIAKESGNALFFERAITPSLPKIVSFLKNRYDALIFTPPTRERRIQFRDFLRTEIVKKINKFQEIGVEKIQSPLRVIPEQKSLRGNARIINADTSISVQAPENLASMKHIIIFDDSFTTGATINAIALKLRSQGYNGKITAITITGNFYYEPGVTDRDEV